jgi:hypothetical protein
MTINQMTLGLIALRLNTLSITSLNMIMTLSKKLSIMTLTVMAFGIISAIKLRIITLIIVLHNDTQYNYTE